MTRYAIAMAALAALSAPASAQEDARCFIEVRKLMAAPPGGLADLRGAIAQLDEALRPQVGAIKQLRGDLDSLQQRQQRAMTDEDSNEDLVALDAERQRLAADLEAKQAQLKIDYAARQQAIVGPVQARVGERAQAFAAERGCADIKLARTPELAALQTGGALDVTGEFVAWYGGGQS
jgi:Skp family chaperone for outer membrane proteins